jgi:hypothetical protein
MTTVSKICLIALALSVVVLAQSAPRKAQTKSPTAATTPSASENKKSQNDAAAKGSGSHTSSMSGNHKDVMGVAAGNNQASASHANNMVGNHKDMMMATAPSSNGKTEQSRTSSTSSPAAQPTAPANKSTTPDPNSPH